MYVLAYLNDRGAQHNVRRSDHRLPQRARDIIQTYHVISEPISVPGMPREWAPGPEISPSLEPAL